MTIYNSEIYYPSCKTAYYATGQWVERSESVKVSYSCRFELLDEGQPTEYLAFFGGVTERTANSYGSFFRADPSKGPSSLSQPSLIRDYYWLQAPISACVRKSFLNITNNSGKFLLSVDLKNIDSVWSQFKTAYEKGKLGYGLQCSTAKINLLSHGLDEKLITVHVEDSFDLEKVAEIAWEIDRLLGERKSFLQYMTDRTTKVLASAKTTSEHGFLYSISYSSFKNKSGKTKKTKVQFSKYFKNLFSANVQQRQGILCQKNWIKFLSNKCEKPLPLALTDHEIELIAFKGKSLGDFEEPLIDLNFLGYHPIQKD